MAFTKGTEYKGGTKSPGTIGRGMRYGSHQMVIIPYLLSGGTTTSGLLTCTSLKSIKGVDLAGASGAVAITAPNQFTITGMGVEAAGYIIVYGRER